MRHGIEYGDRAPIRKDWIKIEVPEFDRRSVDIYRNPKGQYVAIMFGSDVSRTKWEYCDTLEEAYDAIDDFMIERTGKPFSASLEPPSSKAWKQASPGDYHWAFIVARGRDACGDNSESDYCKTYDVPEHRRERVEKLSRSKFIKDLVTKEKYIWGSDADVYDKLDKGEKEIFKPLEKLDMEDTEPRFKW